MRTVCLTGLLSMQNERKLRVIEDIPLYERTSIWNRTEGGSFFCDKSLERSAEILIRSGVSPV